ncbi:MAG: microcin C ABC transporter permease YejB [Alphaproteobacteria bacterium]|nr:microcin C ABC transporter permease YejB [Alphaproteobacteria bacterium]
MGTYIIRRLLLIPFTLFGIMLVNFIFIQAAPGGPVEQVIARVQGINADATSRFSGSGSSAAEIGGQGSLSDKAGAGNSDGGQASSVTSKYRGAQGLDPEFIKELENQFGFDKPAHVRFWIMLKNYAVFDFGQSFFRNTDVMDLVIEKMPVSISLGLWSTLIIYLISIPMGILKATKDGSRFDVASSWLIVIGYAIPGFLFAIALIVLFAGGAYFDWFPLRGLTSENWGELSLFAKVKDYFWHLVLPITAMTVGGFASLTMLTKNSFLEEINKQYVITARAKGLNEKQVLFGHVFRNAMLIVIAGFPATLVNMLFAGSVLIEVIFSLDGLGLLGFEAVMNRDYPVMFGTLFVFSLLGLILNLISDVTYHAVDPRIDFEKRES